MIFWYRERVKVLESGPQTEELRAERESLARHLDRYAGGATPIASKQAIAIAKREYDAAILVGDAKAATAAKDKIAALQRDDRISREMRRAAPARAAIVKAAEDAARADAARRETERAERQAKIAASAEAIAEHLAGLWTALTASRDLPRTVVAASALRLAGARVGASSAQMIMTIVDSLRGGVY